MGESTEQSSKVLVPIDYRAAVGYFLLVAVAYQFGFWKPFGIPIFEYASYSDILRFAIWPVVLTIAGTVIWPWLQWAGSGERGITPLSDTARKRWLLVLLVLMVAGFAVADFVWSPFGPLLWGALVGLGCWQAAREYIVLSGVPSRLHPSVLLMLASMPAWAWGIGGSDAIRIMNGTHFTKVTLPLSVAERAGIYDDEELRLLGRTDAYVLLWMPKRSRVLILSDSVVGAMQLEPPLERTPKAASQPKTK
ncbi:MAG: hypothetical protein WBC67_17855 [Candidatus Acidiferrales bacterium]